MVEKEKWVDEKQFLDWIGMTQLIPGPNSTEMAMHMGYHRGGFGGLLAASFGFIFPSFSISLLFTILLLSLEDIGFMNSMLWLMKPAILGIIFQSVFNLSRKCLRGGLSWGIVGVSFVMSVLGGSPVSIILGMGAFSFFLNVFRLRGFRFFSIFPLFYQDFLDFLMQPLIVFFGIFLKMGAVLYGGGYVLTALSQKFLVEETSILQLNQVLDAVLIGQLTPGPILTAATAMGYMAHGVSGAVLATLGIFLPSVFFVWCLHPWIGRFRKNLYTASFLEGVNAAALGLMLAVCMTFSKTFLLDPMRWCVLIASLVWLWKKPWGLGGVSFLFIVLILSFLVI